MGGEYEIEFTQRAADHLEEMDQDRERRFEKQLDKLRTHPRKYGKALGGQLHGLHQLRFDDSYRIWYRVRNGIVQIKTILHKDEAMESY